MKLISVNCNEMRSRQSQKSDFAFLSFPFTREMFCESYTEKYLFACFSLKTFKREMLAKKAVKLLRKFLHSLDAADEHLRHRKKTLITLRWLVFGNEIEKCLFAFTLGLKNKQWEKLCFFLDKCWINAWRMKNVRWFIRNISDDVMERTIRKRN